MIGLESSIITLAEVTSVYESMRLEEDLKSAGIVAKWWVLNVSLLLCAISFCVVLTQLSCIDR